MSVCHCFPVAGQVTRRWLAVFAAALVVGTGMIAASADRVAAQTSQPQVSAPVPAAKPAAGASAPGPPITAQTTAGDPPARVGRLARMDGTVSFHTADADHWSPATLNYPVTSGNALWTEPGARAELQVGNANRVVMDGGTELDVATLDDRALAVSVPQGTVYLHIQDVAAGNSYAVQTPRGRLEITAPGRYLLAAGDDDHPTAATVIEGAARISGTGLSQDIPAGQTVTLTGPLDGGEPVKAALAPLQQDAFTRSVLAGEQRPPAPVATAPVAAPPTAMPRQVAGMTGAQDLAVSGSWSTVPQYGTVWYPPVAVGWAPYRYGHWAWIPPWGWTWVAEEPWGFAPFHYGRWVEIDNRWAWSPGIHISLYLGRPRPVYAPALVVFFGGGRSVGVLTDDIGWVPLGWHEAYYPPYRVSRTYIRQVNITHVTNVTRVTNVTSINHVTIGRYRNHDGVTVMKTAAMRAAQPVQHHAETVDRRQYANLQANRHPAIRPDNRHLMQHTAPGPQIRPAGPQQDGHAAASRATPREQMNPQAIPRWQPAQALPRHGQTPQPEARRQPDVQQPQSQRQQDIRHQQELQQQQHEAARRQQSQRQMQQQDFRRQQEAQLQQQESARRQEVQRQAQQQAERQPEVRRQDVRRQDAQRRQNPHDASQSD